MDGVPYPQPLAGPEPQYVPWGVLLVRPNGHPPRPVPPRAADQRSRAYPILLRVLRWGRYGNRGGPQTPEVGSLPCVSRGPFASRPPFRCAVCGGWCPVSQGGGGGGGGGGGLRCSWLCCLCACRPLLWSWFAVGVCVCGAVRARVVSVSVCGAWFVVCGVRRWCVVWLVPRHSWRRLLCATPRHSWLGFAACGGVRFPATPGWGSAAGSGVWCVVCGVWCVVSGGGMLVGLWLVCGVVGPSPLLAEFPCATPRRSWLGFAAGGGGRSSPLLAEVSGRRWCVVGLWLVCGVFGPSPLLAEVPVCYSPPLLAGFRCL